MQLELERCRIRAPFNGRIAKVLVSPGSRVRLGDALVQLYDTDAMVLRAQLPARHLPVVRQARQQGKELQVSGEIDAQPVVAKLLRLAGEVSTGSGGVEALFEIDSEADVLQQGRFVRLDLKLPAQSSAIALPFEAVYGTDRVYRVDADQRMRPVRVERLGETRGEDDRSLVLVRSTELADGDRVVITQLPNALDGLLVRTPQDGREASSVAGADAEIPAQTAADG
jgi:multidrug efflux pump subunit AcrA (membrane-fusion protein)